MGLIRLLSRKCVIKLSVSVSIVASVPHKRDTHPLLKKSIDSILT